MVSKETGDDIDNTKFKDGVNRNARIIVRNISFKATEENLREHFAAYGSVEEVKLLKKPDGKLVGCGFVHYTHVPMANKAIAATNKKPFLGRPIYVSWAVPKHKYEDNASEKVRERKQSNTSDEDKDNIKVDDESKPKKDKTRINRNARLIIRNVSFKATEESLKEHFEPYGTVQEVKLLRKPDGKLVGCAFVHFKNVPMAKKALLNTNMKPFLGRPVSVDWAVAKNKYMQHVINQQVEMEEKVKKEESDDDDDGPPLNVSAEDLKQEIKSESGSSDNDESGEESDDESEDDDEKSSDKSSDGEENEDSDEEDVEMDEGDQSEMVVPVERKRIQLNDAEDGLTVFLTNIPFGVDGDQLKEFAEKTGPVKYALICVDKLTEHSKGSGFVKFENKDDADKFLALQPKELTLEGQVMLVKPALKRENLQQGKKKEAKDNRNLYLVKEGVVIAGTKAAVGVSASDMSKRLALERSKTQMLKNLNRFVSRYRLVVSNLPAHFDDAKLRAICHRTVGRQTTITEARVMRDLRAPLQKDGRHPSKGYGFVMFTKHEDALLCLRKLNNNPEVFDKNNRPIVSFSIEDRAALNARKKRLEKSISNNPLAKKNEQDSVSKKKNRKRKIHAPDESYLKKRRLEGKESKNHNKSNRNEEAGKFVRMPVDVEYSGVKTREGTQHKMRSNYKLKTQAEIHKQTLKLEKKKSRRSFALKKATRERIKQPKQKINKNPNKRRKKNKQMGIL